MTHNLTGRRFSRLIVISRGPNLYRNRAAWNCLCDCGTNTVVNGSTLVSGVTKSCGCLRRKDHSVLTYEAVHWRVRHDRGRAPTYSCVDCNQPAQQWSYDHSDLEEVICTNRGCSYSLDPDRYVPRCYSCHAKFDMTDKSLI